jgi:hypothetical protein
MSGFTLCSLVQSLENATLPVVGTALTGLTLEALTTSACGRYCCKSLFRVKYENFKDR